jgi:hypothetical protein
VDINLVSAGSITGLSATAPEDNITNMVASASTAAKKYAEIHVGPQAEPADWDEKTQGEWPLEDREKGKTGDGYPHKINVVQPASGTAYGIRNFTSMSIDKRLLIAHSGDIKNGGGATDLNHYNTYQNFGEITLGNESGLGVETAGADFIAGKLTVKGKGYVMSPGAKNQITFTDIDFADAGSEVVWLKTGTQAAQTGLQTNYFGVTEGWPVITFNPDKANADKVTPANFYGIEMATNKTYIGDSDTHFTAAQSGTTVASGYAVAIPGTKYTWSVDKGQGMISYDLGGNFVLGTEKPSGGYLDVYGTALENTPSQRGSIAIPSEKFPNPITSLPRFSFIPDAELGEWVEALSVWRSDNPGTKEGASPYFHEGEQTLAAYQTAENRIRTWNAQTDGPGASQAMNKEYSFEIGVDYKSGAELTAESAIVTEDDAKTLFGESVSADTAKANAIDLTKAKGRPFFTNNITEQTLTDLAKPLDRDEAFRAVSIKYDAGKTPPAANVVTKTVKIYIVPDDTVISHDKKIALVANDATIPVVTARGITAQSGGAPDALDFHTGAVVIDVANDTICAPALEDADAKISAVANADAGDEISLAYYYAYGTEELSRDVTVSVTGGRISGVAFKEAPEDHDGVYQSDRETPLAGVTVVLLDESGNPVRGVASVVTDADGQYEFDNLDAGTYGVRFALPDLWYVYSTLASGKATGIVIGFSDAADQQKTQDSGYYQTSPVDSGVGGASDMGDTMMTLTGILLAVIAALLVAVRARKKVTA